MSSRFRSSITLAPGFRVNISGSGAGWALPPPGLLAGNGEHGSHFGVGGKGLSGASPFRAPVRNRTRTGRSKELTAISVTCAVDDDGSLLFRDSQGETLSGKITEAAKKQHRASILALMQKKCDEINSIVEVLGNIHLRTPDCREKPMFQPARLEVPPPIQPIARKPSVLDIMLPARLLRLEETNKGAMASYESELEIWKQEQQAFSERQSARRRLVEEGIYHSIDDMGVWLAEKLQAIPWPRETRVSFEIGDAGKCILLDVDLPLLEDMPKRKACMPSRGLKLMVKHMTPTRVKRLYVRHIHAVVFRLIGETFAALPTARTILLSGYAQRAETLSANCLLSVCAQRHYWKTIGLAHLNTLNVVDVLTRLELRRNMTGIGEFQPVEPFTRRELT